MANLQAIADNLFKGKADEVKNLVNQAIQEEVPAGQILNDGLVKGMDAVGAKFKVNEIYVPEVLIAARAMKAGMELLRPFLLEQGVKPKGTVVIGTVRGDLHDIGKNLVCMMMEGAGFRIVDLGIDVPPEKFVEAVKNESADLVCQSALLTTTMPAMKDTLAALLDANLSDKVKCLIGGAPVTQSYADEIGAQGYAPDAATAVEKAKELLGM